MAQFSTLLSVLILFVVFNPIICASIKILSKRRDRSAYIESIEHSSQYFGDTVGSRLKKETTHSKDQPATQSVSEPKSHQQDTKDSIVDKSIRSVFLTNFGPGLYLFKNTARFVNQTYLNPYNDQMVGDQPVLYKDTSTHSLTEEPDKVQLTNELDTYDCLEEDEVNNNKSFCSHLRYYPERNQLEELIKKKFTNLESFFGEDLVLPQNVTERMSNAPNEEYLCQSRVRVIYPQSAQNKNWDWIYIVNSPQYKQGIRIEECIEPYKTCGENTGLSLPNRFTATCEQSYIYRSLIAYSNLTIFKDTFRIPSCCKCVLRSYS